MRGPRRGAAWPPATVRILGALTPHGWSQMRAVGGRLQPRPPAHSPPLSGLGLVRRMRRVPKGPLTGLGGWWQHLASRAAPCLLLPQAVRGTYLPALP